MPRKTPTPAQKNPGVGAPPPLERIVTAIPGPKSMELAGRLARVESPDTTFFSPDFPIVWDTASGAVVVDVDGNRYIDLNAGFGVASVGHGHPRVAKAIQGQSTRLIHGMGDVHPTELKTRLAEELVRRAPGGGDWKVILGLSGAEAVEAALKTAAIATGKPGVITFDDAYHGLSLGTLTVTAWPKFRKGLDELLIHKAARFGYPRAGEEMNAALGKVHDYLAIPEGGRAGIGAILVEPIQGRGGIVVPPEGFLAGLRELCDRFGLLLIFDEVYTGFGRTGDYWACDHEGVKPDLIAAGKALGGGMPISVCIGKAEVIDRWGKSEGEARHTTTFLGHPLGCAAALETLRVIDEERLAGAAAEKGALLLGLLRGLLAGHPRVAAIRGRGMMIGIELVNPKTGEPDGAGAWRVVVEALKRGVIVLGSGRHGNVLSITPPLTIHEAQLRRAAEILAEVVRG